MADNIPATFKAQQLSAFGSQFQLVELPIPQLGENEVLIKVKATPINPYDFGFITGHFGEVYVPNVFPIQAGFEGSGVIANLGSKALKYKINQRVTFHIDTKYRSYAEYAVTNEHNVIPIDDDISFEEGASATINPLTVIGLFDLVGQAKAVVSNAAASQLGRQLQRYFTKRGVAVINIVRRQEQLDILKSEGAQYILNETDPTFNNELKELSTKLNVSLFLDPVAGSSTGTILSALPNGTIVYLYGSLSHQPVGNISVTDLLRGNKTIKGFTLFDWYAKYPGKVQEPGFQKEFNRSLKEDLRTVYALRYPLTRLNEAFEAFKKNPATNGKILIVEN